ncbi:hypothetical protein IFM89_021676 [Coptis chinensis]|uniref:SWI/SNF complex subunit SWI3B n=1 Tax=Coptis chinensis TaxID=261450 RepID=A0A835IBR9_9MAGN|nr:hypothetical protein IFM89_021676 [Coptis chinensis]
MATVSPIKEQVTPTPVLPTNKNKETANSSDSKLQDSSNDVITIPSHSRWFSWDKVHECERRSLPEFFEGRLPLKNPKVYMYIRNSIIKLFRKHPSRKITFTQVRKVLVGDVGSTRRVFDFLEGWGLINYTGAVQKSHSKLDDKENKLSGDFGDSSLLSKKETSKRFCSLCKTVCSIACFVSDKLDQTLCARCFVRGQYRIGPSNNDFRRVEISEQNMSEWTDKETLNLLEAVTHYGDDWKKVAEHVGGRTEKECVARFVKLPFAEQFISRPDSLAVVEYQQTRTPSEAETGEDNSISSSPAKKTRLTPFSDTSNPIMAQVAFLSAMVGSGVAEAAARAAVGALSDTNLPTDQRRIERRSNSLPEKRDHYGTESASGANGSDDMNRLVEAVAEAQEQIQKEEQDIQRSITDILGVQMKDLQDKIFQFEEIELQVEKEWEQLQLMKNLLFADELSLLFKRPTRLPSSGDSTNSSKPEDSS